MSAILPALVVLLLQGQPPTVDEPALADAAAIYIRDLGYEVRRAPGAPATITPEELGRVAERVKSDGAALAFWCSARAGARGGTEVVLYTVRDDGEVRAMPVAGVGGPALARVLGLKLRAVLTGHAEREPSEPMPAPKPPVASGGAPASTVPAEPPTRPSSVAPEATPPSERASASLRATAPRRPVRAWLSAGYRFVIPTNGELLRHRALVEVAVAWRWLETFAQLEVGNEPGKTLAAGVATLADTPLRLGVRGRLTRGRWSFAGGPLVGVHILDGDATGGDGTQGDQVTAVASLGLELGGAVRATDHVAVQLRVLAEYLVPEVRFLVRGERAFTVGGIEVGLGLTLSFAAP